MELSALERRVLGYGINSGQVRGSQLRFDEHGLSMQVDTPYGTGLLKANVFGRFNAYNLLSVLSALLASDVDLHDALNVLGNISAVPGRMQSLGGGRHPLVVIDYAHTPDALEKVLSALAEQLKANGRQGRLFCVFGCGGNRDAGKRPLMGAVANKLAHEVIVTSDNPRNEDPMKIIEDILQGTGEVRVEPDRAAAIAGAIEAAGPGDIVLIAGKGHENYQEIHGVKHPFSDYAAARQVLQKLQGDAA